MDRTRRKSAQVGEHTGRFKGAEKRLYMQAPKNQRCIGESLSRLQKAQVVTQDQIRCLVVRAWGVIGLW